MTDQHPPPRRWLPGLTAAIVLAGSTSAWAAQSPKIVNGVNSHDHPTTGQLLYSSSNINDNNQGSWCSGTLIGCKTFLTAAHCVEDDLNSNHYRVYLQHAGVFDVQSITMHPSYTSAGWPARDVAVLKLTTNVTGIDPTPINTLINPADVGFGLPGEIAGFGRTGGSSSDYGIKRAGQVVTNNCGLAFPGNNDELVCWKFQSPVGNPGDDSNTCNGDSGGPLFMDLGAGTVVAGVTSGGSSSNCLANDNSYDANVYTYRSYILGELGSDSTSACGGGPAVGDPDVAVVGVDGNLAGAGATEYSEFSVGAGANELRVGLNGEDNGTFDVDFYVKDGPGASQSDFDCKDEANSNFAECLFSSPSSGTWSVLARRQSGSGEYQLTATTFGGTIPPCSDGDGDGWGEFGSAACAESGVDCDDGDPAVNPGATEINGNGIDDDCDGSTPACGPQTVAYDEQGRIDGVALTALLIPGALVVLRLRRRRVA